MFSNYGVATVGVGRKVLAGVLVFVLLATTVLSFQGLGGSEAYADDNTVVYLNIGANGFNEGNTSFAGDKAIRLAGGTNTENTSPVLANGGIRLTKNTVRQSGGAFLSRKIHSETGFSAMFNIYLGDGGNNPYGTADGWTFVVSAATNSIGSAGSGGGFTGMTRSFGILYDTYSGEGASANPTPLIGLGLNGNSTTLYGNTHYTISNEDLATIQNPLYNNPPLTYATSHIESAGNLQYAKNYPIYGWADYKQSERKIEYYVSVTPAKPTTPILSEIVSEDFINTLGEDYYIGFVASTGSGYQENNLKQLYVANDYLPDVLEFNEDGSGLSDNITAIEDYTAPNAPSIMQVGTESSSDVAFTLGGSSDENGLRSYQYSLDDGATWTTYANGSTPVLDGSVKITADVATSGDGDGEDATHLKVLARSIDKGGNISAITTQSLATAIIPHATLTTPAADATNVFFADAQSLVIDFSNEMNIATAGSVSITAPSSSVALAGGAITANDARWNAEHTRLTLPLSAVDWGKAYTVKVKGFKNTSGVFLNDEANTEDTFTYSVIARENRPTAAIDYNAETLTGLGNAQKYKINGTEYTSTASGTIAIPSGWLGTSVSIVKLGNATGAPPTYDSAAQSLPIPARPSAPTSSVVTTSAGKINVTDVGTGMFYATGSTDLTGSTGGSLANGDNVVADGATYYVRKAATGSAFVSEALMVEVAASTYTLNATAPTFSAIAFGDAQPNAQSITIENIGNTLSTINSVVSSSPDDFVISGSGGSVNSGSSIETWTVRPAENLSVGVHTATITVTYQGGSTATANVSITVKEATPAATIDYVNERITGLISGQLYSVNGDTAVNASSAGGSGVIALKPEWLGTSISVVKYNSTSSLLSEATPLIIPNRSGAPTAVAVAETFAGFSDGKITGVSTAQEFSSDGGNSWRDVTSGEQTSGITGLSAGNAYQLRVKASNATQVFRSAYQALSIAAGTPPTYTVDLTKSGTHTFDSKVYGYSAVAPLTVGIENTGNQPTGALTVAKGGTNPADFTLSTTSVSSIAVSGSNASAFTVKPVDGLNAGAHTATITVSGDNGLTASFDVSFTVTPTQITGFVNPASFVAGRADDLLPANPTAATVETALLALPAYQNVTANFSGGTVSVPVTGWTNTGTAYDPAAVGEYTFTGILGAIPDSNVGNTADLKPTVTVIINDILHGIQLGESGLYSIGTAEFGYSPAANAHSVSITNIGVNATEPLQAALSGGASSDFTLSDGGAVGSIAIGGSSTALKVLPKLGLSPGTYTDTLTVSGNGSTNTDLVSKTYDVSFTVTEAEITGFAAITDISAGIAGSATYADAAAVTSTLPATVTANYSGGTVSVPVTGWLDTDGYDPDVAGSYTFTATLGSLPANFLNGGGYTATIEVVVGVFVDKTAIAELISSVEEVFGIDGLGIHEDNYVNLQVEAFMSALASAKAIVADPDATQADVDTALALLEAAYGALAHDHPVLSNSHSGGLLAFGEDVEIEIKGDFQDVTAFSLNGEVYELSQGEGDVLIINEDGEGVIGTITKGSAIVNLPAEFSDRLENGTHYISVTFADSYDQKAGTASIVVNRVANEEFVPPTSLPNTGDNVPIGLYGTLISSLMLLIGLLVYRRRLTSQVHVGK